MLLIILTFFHMVAVGNYVKVWYSSKRCIINRKLHSDDEQKRAEVCAESSRWPKWLPELEYATAYMCFKFSKFGKAGVPRRFT